MRPAPVSYAQHVREVLESAAAFERSLPSQLDPELHLLNSRVREAPARPAAPLADAAATVDAVAADVQDARRLTTDERLAFAEQTDKLLKSVTRLRVTLGQTDF